MIAAFDQFTELPRWVAWRNERRGDRATKVPHSPHGGPAKADDPRTWGSRSEAEARARRVVNGEGGGIGIELGDLGDGTSLGGIDLDTCRRDDGTFEEWASEIIERFASYTETSPSGTGAKIFFRYRTVDLPTIRDAMGGPQHGREFKRGNGKDHPPAIELHLSNRYFTVTEQKLEEAPDIIVIVPTDLLSWVLCEAGPIFAGGSTTESANSNGRDSSRSAIAFNKGIALVQAGATHEEMVEALLADPETAEWTRTKGKANGERELRRIWDKAHKARDDDDTELAKAAALSPLEYERQRKDIAARLGISRLSILDKLVASAANDEAPEDTSGKGQKLAVVDPEPWPDPVDGAALIETLVATIRRYVVLEQPAAVAAALWVIHTHAIDAAYVSPRLAITSPEKRCGKTTLLTILGALVARPLTAANMTAATMFRAIEAVRPTLLVDEADTFIAGADELRGVINAGHSRGSANVLRTVETRDGYEVRSFAVWGAVALAAIGKLPGTIEDRSVKIALRRRRPDESVERLRVDRLVEFVPPARRIARWVADHREALRAADPLVPAELHDRAADNWRPLLAIADAAGSPWPKQAHDAAIGLTLEAGEDSETTRTMLLSDLRDLFAARRTDRLASEDIVAHLGALDDRPWVEFRGGKPLTKAQLARLLKPFGVSPGTIRLDDGRTPKGYHRTAFTDAFARYLPKQNATTPQGQDFRGFEADFKTPQLDPCGVSESLENPNAAAGCGVVADDSEERAAILECEAGYPRADAERRAGLQPDDGREP